jgi:hypothetical protein
VLVSIQPSQKTASDYSTLRRRIPMLRKEDAEVEHRQLIKFWKF